MWPILLARLTEREPPPWARPRTRALQSGSGSEGMWIATPPGSDGERETHTRRCSAAHLRFRWLSFGERQLEEEWPGAHRLPRGKSSHAKISSSLHGCFGRAGSTTAKAVVQSHRAKVLPAAISRLDNEGKEKKRKILGKKETFSSFPRQKRRRCSFYSIATSNQQSLRDNFPIRQTTIFSTKRDQKKLEISCGAPLSLWL